MFDVGFRCSCMFEVIKFSGCVGVYVCESEFVVFCGVYFVVVILLEGEWVGINVCWEIVLRGLECVCEVYFSLLRVVGFEFGSFLELGWVGKDGVGELYFGLGGGL